MVNHADDVFHAYAIGVVSMLVCADKCLSHTDVETYANEFHPTGIRRRWQVTPEHIVKAAYIEESPNACNPSQCPNSPNHYHYILTC